MATWVSFFIFFVSAESSNLDAKRMQDFNAFLLKKEARQNQRENAAQKEKIGRAQREQNYEKNRSSFKRPLVLEPPGKESFYKKMMELEKKYDLIREAYSAHKLKQADALSEKIDQTKMIEYGLE